MPRQRIAIIGGGLTGLTCAYELSKEDYSITIFEKNNEVGGLASGFKIHGENLEKTYHHLFATDTDIIDLIDELGISEKLKWHESSMAIVLENKIVDFSTPLDLLKFKPLNIFDRVRTALVGLWLKKDKNWRKYITLTAVDWIKKWNGKNAYKTIWEPLLKGKFHQYYDKVSMAWLWARMHTRGNSRKGIDLNQREILGYPENGFQTIIDKLVEELKKKNVEISTNISIDKIEIKNGKIMINHDGTSEEFDQLVATVPSHVFAKMFTEKELGKEYYKKLSSIDYLGAVCLIFSSDQEISDFYWHNINNSNSPFLIFVQHTNLIEKANYSGKNVYYVGGYYPHDHRYFEASDDSIKTEWYAELTKTFSEFDKSKIIEEHMFKFKFAQHIVTTDYENKIPEYRTPIANVYLSNFSQIFPEDRGTNYAVREGRKIAKIVKEDVK